jgi:hypothetical protein
MKLYSKKVVINSKFINDVAFVVDGDDDLNNTNNRT